MSDSFSFLFLGDHTHAVDAKNRTAIPSSFRRSFPTGTEDKVVLLRGANGCIEGHVRPEWREHLTRLRNLDLYDDHDLVLRRLWLAGVTETELDAQGRVLLPRRLSEIAGIRDQARFIGLGQFFEIWSPERFDEYVRQHSPLYDKLIKKLDGRRKMTGAIPNESVPSPSDAS